MSVINIEFKNGEMIYNLDTVNSHEIVMAIDYLFADLSEEERRVCLNILIKRYDEQKEVLAN